MEAEICAACTERISALRDEISVLREKSQILEIENSMISDKIIMRASKITQLEEILDKISLQRKRKKKVIAFVRIVEDAHEYYDFKDFLREECGSDKYNYSQDDIEDILVKVAKDTNMFNGLSEEDITYIVDEHVVDAKTIHKFEHIHCFCETEYRKVKGITSELTTEDYKEMDRMFPHLCLRKRYEDEESDPDISPVYSVVFQSRIKNYVMNENPEVELLKIEESTEKFKENDVPEEVEDITSRLIEALDLYSTLRNRGKKTAYRPDNYSKLKNIDEENLDMNLRNQGEDSDRYDCRADWVTVSVP